MNFLLEAVRDKPQGLWMMDDTTPLQDYSGYGRSGTITGSPTRHASLTAGAVYSQVFGATVTASVPAAFIQQGQESKPFTLETVVVPINTTTAVGALTHAGQLDGITITGNVVSFSTKYSSTGSATATAYLDKFSRYHIVGVHTASKNSLYVNGELVSEVLISEEQQADTYASSASSFVIGETATASAIAVGASAVYSHALSAEAVQRHYEQSTVWYDDVASMYDGIHIPLDKRNANTFVNQHWSTPEAWSGGTFNAVALNGSIIAPEVFNDLTLPGTWLDSVVLETPLYGVALDWEGRNVTVEASLNGTAWEVAQKGRKLALISEGATPVSTVLQIRVTFTGGLEQSDVYLSSLSATGFRTGILPSVSGRTVTLLGATPQDEFHPSDFNELGGTRIETSGSITINVPTTTGAISPRSVEVWIKPITVQPTFSFSGTNYRDGVASSATLPLGKWTLVHVTTATPIATALTISGQAQVGQVVLYDRQLTATEITDISASYAGTNILRVDDGTLIDVTQVAEGATVYAHDWSILGAG